MDKPMVNVTLANNTFGEDGADDRKRIATAAMQGYRASGAYMSSEQLAAQSVRDADALLAELEGEHEVE